MVAQVCHLPVPDDASPADLIRLADQFGKAADKALRSVKRGDDESRGAFRVSALRAIDLALSAALIHNGHSRYAVRAMQTNLHRRAILVATYHIVLDGQSLKHLYTLNHDRPYHRSRYDQQVGGNENTDALAATLRDVLLKVRPFAKAPERVVSYRPRRPVRAN